MLKEDLVRKVKESMNLASMKEAASVVDGFSKVLGEIMRDGETVVLPGVGKFEVATRGARTARNPRTGETIEVPEKKSVRFKAAAALKRSMNE